MAHRSDWFSGKWGVLTHYLVSADMAADEWNRRVDSFNVARLIEHLVAAGAQYYFMTIGQNSGHYCSPNSIYDELTGIKPSKCSRRDLILDLSKGLGDAGIGFLVYLPSGAPEHDTIASQRFGWEKGTPEPWTLPPGQARSNRLSRFQRNWESIIREWSVRWGNKVKGWWIDGCYYADDMYRHADEPNFHSFASALRAGSADSMLAFNNGKSDALVHSDEDDYTAGEVSHWFPICYRRWVTAKEHQAQFHVLSFVGETWGGSKLRFPDEFVAGYTRQVTQNGGAVTWDVPIGESGLIPGHCIDQLKRICHDHKPNAVSKSMLI